MGKTPKKLHSHQKHRSCSHNEQPETIEKDSCEQATDNALQSKSPMLRLSRMGIIKS